ncbi:MAG: sugar kinase, partial [Bdellovibrionota bacterium]
MAERLQLATRESPPLWVIGVVGYDDILMPSGERVHQLGGAAAYASIAASYFTKTSLVSLVGSDFSQEDEKQFTLRGIDLRAFKKIPGKTFYWKARYSEGFKSRETLELELNVYKEFRPDYPENLSSYVFLSNMDP